MEAMSNGEARALCGKTGSWVVLGLLGRYGENGKGRAPEEAA